MKLWQPPLVALEDLGISSRHARPQPSCLAVAPSQPGVMELSERALNVEYLFLW
jgi:hypothetical protein